MNERLTQELYTLLSGYAATPSPRDFAVAQCFYNLALADVKGEVEKELKHSRDSQAFSNRESRENGVDYYNSGRIDTLMKLEDFIDNLTK